MEYIKPFVLAMLGSISTVVILGAIAYILRAWLIERLKVSIKHEYDLKLVEIERQKEIRLKGEVVSDLLAQWIRRNGKLDYYELNRLSFQAFLWLPQDLAQELSDALSHQTGAQDIRTLIKNVRTYLQDESDAFAAKDVIVFSEPDLSSGFFNTPVVKGEAVVTPKPR